MSKLSATETAQTIGEFVNIMGYGLDEFIEEMSCKHRTLQQSFTNLCVAWFEDLAKREHFDARNEASVMLARKFVERIGADERYLPLI